MALVYGSRDDGSCPSLLLESLAPDCDERPPIGAIGGPERLPIAFGVLAGFGSRIHGGQIEPVQDLGQEGARKAAVEVLEGVYRKQPSLGERQALQGTVVQYALRA